jgi:hypothetical protein
MNRVAYVLHRFPGITDTFIKREIRSLQKLGTEVQIISVWKPRDLETTPEILSEWSMDTQFVLPRSIFSILKTLIFWTFRSPGRLLRTAYLAFSTARPGFRGLLYHT